MAGFAAGLTAFAMTCLPAWLEAFAFGTFDFDGAVLAGAVFVAMLFFLVIRLSLRQSLRALPRRAASHAPVRSPRREAPRPERIRAHPITPTTRVVVRAFPELGAEVRFFPLVLKRCWSRTDPFGKCWHPGDRLPFIAELLETHIPGPAHRWPDDGHADRSRTAT
jgi:hypothetical protein